MQSGDFENKLRELVERGDVTDLGLTPTSDGKLWRATYAPASVHGLSIVEDADPVKALYLALTNIKIKSRKVTADKPIEPEPEPARDEYLDGIVNRDDAYDPAA
jgi:hypothetical protein